MPNIPGLAIREMQYTDLPFTAACTSAEGWASEDLATLEGFFLHDNRGCFIAELGGQPAGMCIATCYGASGFIGELIVGPASRGRGIGASLLNHSVDYLRTKGVETVYLDGVLKAVDLYERNGFRKICRSWRFTGHLAGQSHPNVRRMTQEDMQQVASLDSQAFGEDRSFFLLHRLERYPDLGWVMVEGGHITGYILGRSGEAWLSAGPWVVSETISDPGDLLQAFALGASGRPVTVGILEKNHAACDLVRSLGFEARADSPWRMAFGPFEHLGASLACYAIGSAAMG
jgi:ribosomal protein S18 acetylase RimI-like enzyme